MARRNLNDLLAFVTVAREGSFTRAAAALGVTQSALSQAIRGLEDRLEIRLLTRTTRSVAPTAAGERLANAIGHRFEEIEAELDALTELARQTGGHSAHHLRRSGVARHDAAAKADAVAAANIRTSAIEIDISYGCETS